MVNFLFYAGLALVAILSWKLLKHYEKQEREIIAEYN